MAGLELSRVAEVIAGTGDSTRRGSGYEVAAGVVLTAAHVVAGATTVRARFNADRSDERVVDADVSFTNSRGDVALLTLPAPGDEVLTPVYYGRLGDQAAIVRCTAVGFPRFKLREDPPSDSSAGPVTRYRDSHQIDGTIACLAGVREGTLEVVLAPPERDPDHDHSPWEGMSGAPLWCRDLIVGIVSQHHPREGLNRLAAVRAERWYQELSPADLSLLCGLTGLPRDIRLLPDVVSLGREATDQRKGRRGRREATRAGDVLYQNVVISTGVFTGRDSFGSGKP